MRREIRQTVTPEHVYKLLAITTRKRLILRQKEVIMPELPGWGDLGHPDEWDDGRCSDCGYEDCTDVCVCEYCAPFSCYFCDEPIREDHSTLNAQSTEDGDDICDECWKTYPDNPANKEA